MQLISQKEVCLTVKKFIISDVPYKYLHDDIRNGRQFILGQQDGAPPNQLPEVALTKKDSLGQMDSNERPKSLATKIP